MHILQLLADSSGAAAAGAGLLTLILDLVFYVVAIAPLYGVFTKAGEPGWAAVVPVYNLVILLKIVGRPAWWVVLYLIPVVGLVAHVLVMLDLAKTFGQEVGFAVGLILLWWVFFLILWFGPAQYTGPVQRAEGALI